MNGPAFRALRNATGLSQAGFAAELGYGGQRSSKTALVSSWETGRRGIPTQTALLAQLVASRIVMDRESASTPTGANTNV